MKHLWFERGAYASKSVRQFLSNGFSPNKIKKIAIIRHAALGDQVIARPFMIEARKFFPNAQITLVGVSNYQYAMPYDLADRVVIMHGKHRKTEISFAEKIRNIKELGEQDIIFDVAGTNRSYWMTALTKAKVKFGFPYKPYLCGTLYNAAVFRSDYQPEVEVMLDMLRFLGHVPSQRLEYGYPDNKDYPQQIKPTILYFNGASTPTKILNQSQMRELIKQAMVQFPEAQHVYLEGKGASEKGGYLQDLTQQDHFRIQPCLPLDELLIEVAKARLVVAPDTGIRNVAISTHTPTVGIFYSTVPFRYTPRYESFHHIVMNPCGSIPSNDSIINIMSNALECI